MRYLRVGVCAVMVLCGGAAHLRAQPSVDFLRIVAPAAPGGGWDQTARAMQQALTQSGIVRTAPVENVPGAAGTIALARFLGAERGRSDTLMVSGLIMVGGVVTYRSPVTTQDVTPIARLTGEYEVIVVPKDSPFTSLADVIRALEDHPEAVSWGGGSAGGSDQILAGLIAEAIGISPRRINYIAFSGGGESLSAIVGGQVSVGINGLAELEGQIEAGAVRPLAISSGQRLEGLDVPTLREQGVDVEFENWRSVMAPPGITRADRLRLEGIVEAMVRSPEWRAMLDRYRWLDRYEAGSAFAAFLGSEEARVRAILQELGTGEDDSAASTGAYPLFVLAGLLVFGIASVVRRPSPTVAPAAAEARASGPLWLIGTGIVADVLLAERLGFVLASALLFWLTARAFDRDHPIRDGVFAVGVSVSAYLLFTRLLQLPLPAGVFAGWV